MKTNDNEIYVTKTKIIVPISLGKTEQNALFLIKDIIKHIQEQLEKYHYFHITHVEKDGQDFIIYYKVVLNENLKYDNEMFIQEIEETKWKK